MQANYFSLIFPYCDQMGYSIMLNLGEVNAFNDAFFIIYILFLLGAMDFNHWNKFTEIQEEMASKGVKRFNLLCLECDNSDLIV